METAYNDRTPLEKAHDEFGAGNFSAALALLKPLVELGDPIATCNLASMYFCGLGVAVDGRKALDILHKIADQNIDEGCASGLACNELATLYAVGTWDVDPDPSLARKYRLRSEELGFMKE